MLYTICYAGHTTVYIIGIYHGILNDIYIRIYHGIYHNIFSSFISHWILVPSSPPWCSALLVAASSSGVLLRASVNLSLRLCSA